MCGCALLDVYVAVLTVMYLDKVALTRSTPFCGPKVVPEDFSPTDKQCLYCFFLAS